jgi:ATP-dependent DNA helicase RecG
MMFRCVFMKALGFRPSVVGEEDVIGNVYEYLLERFASNAGKKAGEVYTPGQVSALLARLLALKKGNTICDPACGSGSLLIKVGRQADERNFALFGQESNGTTHALCRMSIADLDDGKLKRFVERAGLKWDTPANAVEKLGLLKDGKLLNAAPLFFAKVAPMELRCAVFGTTDSAMIIDRHDIQGDILELIEEAQRFVLKNIHIGMRLNGLYRVDVPEVSVDALREAIINAFCHRDYRDPDYVQVAIFKDRVEIRNPGGLFGGLTVKDLRRGHVSKRRNPLICEMFRRIQMVEAWGRGMPLILRNEPKVKFKEIADIFIVSFGRPSSAEGIIRPDFTEASVKASVKTSVKLLELLARYPEMTLTQVAVEIKRSTRAVEMASSKLVKEGRLRHVGPQKGGHWEVLK